MSFGSVMDSARRYSLLRILAEAPDYRAGTAVLYEILKRRGPVASYATVQAALRWLAANYLVKLEDFGDYGTEARLTVRGLDVAAGRETVRGVRRPLPGEEFRGE